MVFSDKASKTNRISDLYVKFLLLEKRSPFNSTVILLIFSSLILLHTYYFFSVIQYTKENVFDAITINLFLFGGILLLFHPQKPRIRLF